MALIDCPFCNTNVWVNASGICPSCSMAVGSVSVDGQKIVPKTGPCDFCNNETPDVNRSFAVQNDRDFWNIMLIGMGGLFGGLLTKKEGVYVECKSCEGCIAASKRSSNWRVKLYSALFFWSVMGLLLILTYIATTAFWTKLLAQVGLGLFVISWIAWLGFVHGYVRRATPQLLGSVQDARMKRLFRITQWGTVAVDLLRNKPTGIFRKASE